MLVSPHMELNCVIGNFFIATMGTMAEAKSFAIESDEKVGKWKYPSDLAVSKR